jgi:hypothetical protein
MLATDLGVPGWHPADELIADIALAFRRHLEGARGPKGLELAIEAAFTYAKQKGLIEP